MVSSRWVSGLSTGWRPVSATATTVNASSAHQCAGVSHTVVPALAAPMVMRSVLAAGGAGAATPQPPGGAAPPPGAGAPRYSTEVPSGATMLLPHRRRISRYGCNTDGPRRPWRRALIAWMSPGSSGARTAPASNWTTEASHGTRIIGVLQDVPAAGAG